MLFVVAMGYNLISMEDDWPFDDPKNVAVITLKSTIWEGKPILYVTHDDDDGAWQFLDGYDVSEDRAMVVGLEEIVKHDPSIRELADLPYDWYAWRPRPDAPWTRAQIPAEWKE